MMVLVFVLVLFMLLVLLIFLVFLVLLVLLDLVQNEYVGCWETRRTPTLNLDDPLEESLSDEEDESILLRRGLGDIVGGSNKSCGSGCVQGGGRQAILISELCHVFKVVLNQNCCTIIHLSLSMSPRWWWWTW